MNFLQLLLRNKHTTGAAAIVFLCQLANGITLIWSPSHKDQMEQTTKLIIRLAISYGLLMAGDANPSQPKSNENKTPVP